MGEGACLHDRHCSRHVISNALSRCPAQPGPTNPIVSMAVDKVNVNRASPLLPFAARQSRATAFPAVRLNTPQSWGYQIPQWAERRIKAADLQPCRLETMRTAPGRLVQGRGKRRGARRAGLPLSHSADSCRRGKIRIGDWCCCKSRNNTSIPARGISALTTVPQGPPRQTAGNESSGEPPAPKGVWRQEPPRAGPMIFS